MISSSIKILQKVANVKIETKVKHYKINRWYKKGNALHYYKEDSVEQQLYTPYNPMTANTKEPDIDYSDYSYFFTVAGRHTSRQIVEKVSQIKQLEQFYKKSL